MVAEVDGDLAYLAWGFGGQVIAVVPDRDLVVVFAAETDIQDALSPNKAVGPSGAIRTVKEFIARMLIPPIDS